LIGLGKLFIILFSTIVSVVIMIYGYEDAFSPMIVVIIGVFIFIVNSLVSSEFLGLFDEAILCILQCVAIDMELHAGIPRFGSKSFREAMKFEEN